MACTVSLDTVIHVPYDRCTEKINDSMLRIQVAWLFQRSGVQRTPRGKAHEGNNDYYPLMVEMRESFAALSIDL